MGIGCLVYLVLLGVLYFVEKTWLEGIGLANAEMFAGPLAVSGVMFLGCANRLRKAVARIQRTGFHPERWKDGELIRLSGKAMPVGGARLLTPLTRKPAVAFTFEFYVERGEAFDYTFAGMDAGAFEIQTPEGSLPVKGFPLLLHFGAENLRGESWYRAAAQWLASREWEEVKMSSVGPVMEYLVWLKGKMPTLPMNQMDQRRGAKILPDDVEGIVRKLSQGDWVFVERFIAPAAEVTVEGTYVANPPAIDLSYVPENPKHKISPGASGKKGWGWPVFGMLYFGGPLAYAHWMIGRDGGAALREMMRGMGLE